jgi:hypothetical protein
MQRKFYIKCENSNGKLGDNNFVMEFCVDDGPDISAPEILGTNYGEEAFIQAGVTEVPIEVYTGEPAVCKWDTSNKEYDLMVGTFKVCSLDIQNYTMGYNYGCSGTFGGLKDNVDNKFYIKCKDKPWVDAEGYEGSETRFANTEPYELILKGTQPLVIEEINVNGQTENILIKDSATTIKATIEVKTSAGANTGKAKCRFREEGDTQYTNFYNNENFNFVYPNTHDLPLEEGTYDYEILCYDEGGNSAEGTISFEIETDKEPPTVIRAYHELTGDYLKIVTDENAECVYDVVDCSYNFDDGFKMASTDSINHFVTWNTQINFYIKCKDGFGNWPYPNNVCSIVVKPSRV